MEVISEKLDPAAHLPQTGEIEPRTYSLAREICESLHMHPDTVGIRPSVLAGTALYVTGLALDAPAHTHQTAVAELTGTSTTSIRTHMPTVAQHVLDESLTDGYRTVDTDVLEAIADGEPADVIIKCLSPQPL